MTSEPCRPAHAFPFSAVVGQEALKTALILNAVDPRVGGVLVRGERGTAKSTAVRALAAVLPAIDVNEGCRFSCDPSDPGSWCSECRERVTVGPIGWVQRTARVVELPVSATEDRLVGTLDFEAALKRGERSFLPGLLADANRSILYVDEVNLLDDHLVDTLLDAAAMGVNTVEREGVSMTHPARFILVGTMNPEEGEIRPQLLDRFGLCVDVEGVREPEARVEIVKRRHAFEEDPESFGNLWAEAEHELRGRISRARVTLPSVGLADSILYAIADLCIRAGVDGHRADTVMARAAAAFAALEGRSEMNLGDVERVAPLVLGHRLRRARSVEVRADAESLRAAVVQALAAASDGSVALREDLSEGPGVGQASIFDPGPTAAASATRPSSALDPGVSLPVTAIDSARRSISGKRQEAVASSGRGRYARSEKPDSVAAMSDVAFDATIRAAASAAAIGGRAGSPQGMVLTPTADDVRTKVRTRRVGASIVFCVDASGSMGSDTRMEAAKAAVIGLLKDAYQKRDRVALVSFRGRTAEVVLSPTASVELANLKLRSLPTGGATPLAAGLACSLELIEGELRRQPDTIAWLVLVTDGRGNVGLEGGSGSEDALAVSRRVRTADVRMLVVDTSSRPSGASSAREIADAAGAEYVRLQTLDGEVLSKAVRERV